MQNTRLDHEIAKCIEDWGWKYHHAKHNFEIISESDVPSDGVRSTMILHNGAPTIIAINLLFTHKLAVWFDKKIKA